MCDLNMESKSAIDKCDLKAQSKTQLTSLIENHNSKVQLKLQVHKSASLQVYKFMSLHS